jgi:2'-phosphotransferase
MARGGRGGGGRNPANQPRDVQVSRKVSWLLRHGAGQEGLKLGKGGYVNVQDAVSLLACSSFKDMFNMFNYGER